MPRAKRVVVANTTPIVALALIGRLDLLEKPYAEVLVPPTVEAEVLAGGASGIGRAELQASSFVRVTPLKDPSRADLLSDLDRGEAEVIALAQELNADLVIVDERLARKHAKRLGLKMTGTVGALLEGKRQGYITAIKPSIEELVRRGIRLSAALVEQALKLAGED